MELQRKAKEGIAKAVAALSSGDTSQAHAVALIDAASDVLAPYLDKKVSISHPVSRISR